MLQPSSVITNKASLSGCDENNEGLTHDFILALRLELVIAYQVSGVYSSASVAV